MEQSASTLDTGQYTRYEIEKYEAVYGRNFVSPGGVAAAQEFTALLALQPGQRVLDVGCGIGGSAFYMAQQYGVQVDGLDLSTNMLALARERCQSLGLTEKVHFLHANILEFTPSYPYDAVYSRDAFLHIHDKAGLFAVIKDALAPGGKLLFTDYCCGEGEKSQDFTDYIQERQYALCTVAEYSRLLAEAGMSTISAEDRLEQFITILEREEANLATTQLDPATVAELRQSWQNKLVRARRGEQRWALFQARRPDGNAMIRWQVSKR
jgi:phosphoethanolamine N-methyltransferase